jgi:glycolate oxidase FAD binding subunit
VTGGRQDGPGGCPWRSDRLDRIGVPGPVPTALLSPRTREEVASALEEATRRRVPVLATGSGRHLALGPPPAAAGWVLSTGALDRIVDHTPDDLTATAEAGTTLGALQERLAAAGQHVPHVPPGWAGASLGGLLATHLPGITRHGHGPLRDRVLGLTVALATGEVVRSGGRVVKNVAGYDLHRLHTGAWGTLGVILEVTVKVAPLPPGRTLLTGPAGPPRAAVALARRLARSPLLPVAVLAATGPGLAGAGTGPALLVAVEDSAAGRDRASADVIRMAREGGVGPLARSDVPAGPEAWPAAWVDFPLDAELALRLAVPPSRMGDLIDAIPTGSSWLADLGEGLLTVALAAGHARASAGGAGAPFGRATADGVRAMAAAARALGGWTAVVKAPAPVWDVLSAELAGAAGRPAFARMEAIRASLDPAGVLHPSRMPGALL